MGRKFKKNEKYDQDEITKLIYVYHMAIEADDKVTAEEALTRVFHFIEKYVYKTLWENYRTLMQNPSHREDLIQEVWVRIFKELKNYNPEKGALTTFIAPWIRHVVSDYTSKNFRNTSVYYANAMQKINGAQNFCKTIGLNSNDMDTLMRLTGLSDITIKNTLGLLDKKDSVSYEALIDAGADYSAHIKGPEESVLEAEAEQELLEICEETLTNREMMLFQMLLNPENDGKGHSSYREIMEKIPESNIPQIKKEISRIMTKLRANKKFSQRYPLIAHQEKILEENYIPVLDSDDRDDLDEMFASFVDDMDKTEESDSQVKKMVSTKAANN